MKKSIVAIALATLSVLFNSTAIAESWYLSVDSNTWDSPVVTGLPPYDYEWDLTQANLLVEGGDFQEPTWIDLLPWIAEGDKGGSGSSTGLPIVIFHQFDPLHIDLPGIIADIWLVVLSNGHGSGRLAEVTLGPFNGGGSVATDAEFGGNLTVTGIPEPVTILLLGLGGAALVTTSCRSAGRQRGP